MLRRGPASAIPRIETKNAGRRQGEGTRAGACVDAGQRRPGPCTRSRSPAPLSTAGPDASPVPQERTQGPGYETESVLCIFFFNQSKKKSHLKRPRDPLRSPATHLRAVPGGGGVHARPEFPTPFSALPSRAAAAGLPGKPPSFRRGRWWSRSARARSASPPRARAPPAPVPGLPSRDAPGLRLAGRTTRWDSPEGGPPLLPACARRRPSGPQSLARTGALGSGSCAELRADLSPTGLLIAGWDCGRVWERKSPETGSER